MKSSALIVAITLMVVNSAVAQAQGTSSALEAGRFSVQAGLGFFAEDNLDGFMLNFEGTYHIDESWSAGVDLQLGFEDDILVLSMPIFGRYDFGDLPVDVQYLSDVHPFVKLGLGFTYADFDGKVTVPTILGPVSMNVDFDDTGFLFMFGGGLAYPINDQFSVESTMQFNITTNDFFEDDFYFSWEMISLRYHF